MKIECVLHRKGGTRATIGNIEYHFKPQADGAHVCEVEDKKHIGRFLALNDGYQVYEGEAKEVPKGVTLPEPEPAPPKASKAAAPQPEFEPTPVQIDDEEPEPPAKPAAQKKPAPPKSFFKKSKAK